MRKLFSILLILAFVLAFAACSKSSETIVTNDTPRNTSTKSPQASVEEPLPETTQIDETPASENNSIYDEQVLFDQEGIKITFQGFDPDHEHWGPEIMFYIENFSDNQYLVQARNFAVNGIYVACQLSLRYESGESGLMPLYIFRSGLYDNKIDVIENVELSFYLMRGGSTGYVIESDIVFLDLSTKGT